MAHSSETAGPLGPEATSRASRPNGLMAKIYRDVGLAAVASELALPTEELGPELSDAVKRGARYIYLMPNTARKLAHE